MSLSRTASFCATLLGIGILAACASPGGDAASEESDAIAGDNWKDRAKLEADYATFFKKNQEDLLLASPLAACSGADFARAA